MNTFRSFTVITGLWRDFQPAQQHTLQNTITHCSLNHARTWKRRQHYSISPVGGDNQPEIQRWIIPQEWACSDERWRTGAFIDDQTTVIMACRNETSELHIEHSVTGNLPQHSIFHSLFYSADYFSFICNEIKLSQVCLLKSCSAVSVREGKLIIFVSSYWLIWNWYGDEPWALWSITPLVYTHFSI